MFDLNSHDYAHGSWLIHENRKALAHMLYMRLILKFYQKKILKLMGNSFIELKFHAKRS